jgi:hypothetical protein
LPAVEPDARPAVIVWWFDVDGLFEDGFSMLSHRTTQIFREIGVEVSVRTGEVLRRTPGEGPRQIAGVLMRQPVLAWELKPEVMGTVIRPGPDTLYVFLPRILETLGLDPEAREYARHEIEEIAEALGRVIAHETVHAVAAEHPHAEDGLMAGRLNRKLLLRPDFSIDATCARAFRAALDRR